MIPVHVVTGFLGSGKTTLLQRILADPAFADSAVIVNELGEIGLDHHLIDTVDGEVVLMKSGCICCTVRSDIGTAIRDLHARRERGSIPPFRRLLVETTGLADPVPVLATVMQDPVIRHHFRLGHVVATIDAVNGAATLDRQPESVKQAAVADRLLLTKTDLAGDGTVARIAARLARLNPAAPVYRLPDASLAPSAFFGDGLFDPRGKSAEVRRWFSAVDPRPSSFACHDAAIDSFVMTFDRPIDWTAFGVWLTLLLHAHGNGILRVKGLLQVAGTTTPVVIHGVQHLVHPPIHLKRWPDADRRSRIVFITRGVAREPIERSFATFQERLGTAAPVKRARVRAPATPPPTRNYWESNP